MKGEIMGFMRRIIFVGVLCCVFNVTAHADMFDFEGNIDYHNEVDYYYFSLSTSSTLVEIWTDSYDGGANFDPITALWDEPTGNLIAQNDDDASIRPADQTSWDSGIALSSLAAGDYFFTIASYNNFASGSNISDGFAFDGESPIPIEQWWVEAPGYYHLNFSGVDSVGEPVPVVPVPGAVLLGMLGLGTAGMKFRKHS